MYVKTFKCIIYIILLLFYLYVKLHNFAKCNNCIFILKYKLSLVIHITLYIFKYFIIIRLFKLCDI